ncbi:hypothetical protein niasHT_038730 [Heterodera trifolii]|uniref:C2H2-type domain-containing protein n=1 Tax=Heterodera trifolii TaxID=157864 RepID=A0ABD2J113_9BILA
MIVNWTKPEHLSYQGLYRVRVIPPRGLRIPVLPMKIDERLLFSCCHRCAALFRKSVTRCAHKCEHSEQQRAFTGNFTHIELEKALEMGYVIDRFWRAWHYDEWSDQVFKGYVRQFIRLKELQFEHFVRKVINSFCYVVVVVVVVVPIQLVDDQVALILPMSEV